jgi:hypothetical protein
MEECKEEIPEKKIECPPSSDPCQKNAAPLPVPDWRKTQDPFKNEKEEKYSVTITLEAEVKTLAEIENSEDIKKNALLEMLDFYGKDEKNIEGTRYSDLQIEKLYIDPRIKIKPKVLVSVSYEKFDEIPNILSLDEEEGEEGEGASTDVDSDASEESDSTSPGDAPIANYVILEAPNLNKIFDDVAENIMELSIDAVKASYKDPESAITINLSKEAGRLLSYKSSLISFIEKNDYDLYKLEKVKIKFDKSGINSVEVGPKSSCSKILTKGFQSFKKKPEISRQLTNSLVSRLPDIYDDFNSRKSLDYVSFINKYMISGTRLSSNGYFDRTSAQDIYPFRKFVADQFETKMLKTREEVEAEQDILTDTMAMRSRYESLITEEFGISDPIMNNLPDLIKTQGNASDLNSFWSGIINGIGKRGMSSLARVALNKAQENLDIDLNNSIMSTSFVMNLSNADLVRFIDKIPPQEDLQRDIDGMAEDILVGIGIDEYQIPWKEGSSGGNISSFNRQYNSPSYDREPLSEYEDKMRYGTIATGYRERATQEVYNAYRQAITETMPPEDILALSVNFQGPSFYDILCLRDKFGTVDAEINLPKFNGKIGLPTIPQIQIPDLLSILIQEAISAALKLILNTILMIIEKILSALGDGVCDAPSNFGIEDIPSSSLRTIIKNSVPIQEDIPGLVDTYIAGFLSSSGFLLDTTPETRSIVTDFVDDISVTLTENELMLLLTGQPTEEVLVLVSELAKMRDNYLSQQLTDPNSVADLFSSLSNFIPHDFLNNQTDPSPINPTSIGICRDEGALDKFSALRCSLLGTNKGLGEEQCKEHLDILKDLAKNDVEDLNNIIQNFDNMIGCSLPSILSDPSCPNEKDSSALLPQIPEQIKEALNSTMSSYFDTLELSMTRDLVDHQGFLDMILTDKLGAGFKQHNNLINGPFGKEDGASLGLFQFFASTTGTLASPLSGESLASFPDNVAAPLKTKLENITENYEVVSDDKYDIFEYEYPMNVDGYQFLLADTNTTGEEYILKVKEIMSTSGASLTPPAIEIFEESDLYVRGSENLDVELRSYLDSEIGINLNSPSAKKDVVISTIMHSWPNSKENTAALTEFSEQLYFYFYKKYTKEVADKIVEEDDDGNTTFSYGFSLKDKPTKVCLDHEQFGGTKENPAFYYEPPARYGWLDIYDKIIPEEDGEEPKRKSIINFEEISSKIMENSEIFPDDERIYVNNRKKFIPPFYQIFDKTAKAMIEASLRSTTRIYVFDTMMKGINIFSKFKPDFPKNFDGVLASYIAENMKVGLLEEGKTLFGKKDDSYYLEFIEQAVQSYGNLIDASMVEPTPEEQDAIKYLNEEQSKLKDTCSASKKENKKIKLEFLRREDIQRNAMVILKRYIENELEIVSKSFEEALKFQSENVDEIFVQNETWVQNPIELGKIIEEMTNPKIITDVVSDISDEAPGEWDKTFDDLEYVPFVLERYIKIEDYDAIEAADKKIPFNILNRPENLFGIVNIQSWSDFLNTLPDDKKISDFWKSWKYGIRVSIIPTTGVFDGKTFQTIAEDLTAEECQKQKAYKLGTNKTPLMPLVSYEESIPDETPINADIDADYNKKQDCLLYDFFNSPQYKSIFKYSLSFSRILSMMGIYVINGLLPSLQDRDASYLGPHRGLKSWDRQTMKKSKKQARIIFETTYHSQDPNYRNKSQRRPTEYFRENNRIRFSSVDAGLKWFERKLQVPRPFDKDGKPQDYEGDCS